MIRAFPALLLVALYLTSCTGHCPESYEADNLTSTVYNLDTTIESSGYPGDWNYYPHLYRMFHRPGSRTCIDMSFRNDGCNDTWLGLILVFSDDGRLRDHEVSYAYHDCEEFGDGSFMSWDLEGHTSVDCDLDSLTVTWHGDEPTVEMVFGTCTVTLEHDSPPGAPRVDQVLITGSVESPLRRMGCE